jgi:hypothetical protein
MQSRQSVDLSAYPDLIVIMLGFRVSALRGFASLLGIGKGLRAIAANSPEGLLAHEQCLFALNHVGIRQYWRDLESLERFTRSAPHAGWWRDFAKLSRGAGFWHETYARNGAMEALYANMPSPMGFGRFAPPLDPVGPFLTARARMGRKAA